MLKLRRLKKEIEEASKESQEAVERAEQEKVLQRHLNARLNRIQIDVDNLSRRSS